MTVLSLVFEARSRPGKADALRTALHNLVAPTRREDGCLSYDLHASLDEPDVFVLTEHWQSVEQWERHMATPHLDDFRKRADGIVAHSKLHRLKQLA